MNCRRVSNLLSAYMDGELTGVEMLEIRSHLNQCQSCNAEHSELREAKAMLSHLLYAAPRAGLAESICARVDCVRVPRYQRVLNRLYVFGRGKLTPVAAGCVGLAGVMMFMIAQPVQGPDMVAQSEQHRTTFASAIGFEPGRDAMPTVAYFTSQPEPRSSIPAASSEGTGSGPAYILTAGYEGQ